MNSLLNWWQGATPEGKRNLAAAVGTTVPALHQMAHAYRTAGVVNLSPETAKKIEQALAGAIKREHLCRDCRECDLAAKARN